MECLNVQSPELIVARHRKAVSRKPTFLCFYANIISLFPNLEEHGIPDIEQVSDECLEKLISAVKEKSQISEFEFYWHQSDAPYNSERSFDLCG